MGLIIEATTARRIAQAWLHSPAPITPHDLDRDHVARLVTALKWLHVSSHALPLKEE